MRRRARLGRFAMGAVGVALALPAVATPLSPPTVSGGSLTWLTSAATLVQASGGGEDASVFQYRTSADGTTWSAPTTGTSISVSDQGETYVQFRAGNPGGDWTAWTGAPSAEGMVRLDRTDPGTPGQPTAPTPAPQGELSWTAVSDSGGSGVAGYFISRDGVQVGWSTGTTYVDASPGEGGHLYRVAAVDGAGNTGAQSTARSVQVDATPPSTPTLAGAQPTPTNTASVTLTASGASDSATGVAGYESRTSTDGGAWSDAAAGATVTVTAEGETLVQVRAVDGAGNVSAWTPTHSGGADALGVVRIDRTPPARPAPPEATGWPLGITWQPVPGATGYRLMRGGLTVVNTAATGYVDAAAGDRAAPPAPDGLVVSVPASGAVNLRWTATADAGTEFRYTLKALDAAGNISDVSDAATVPAVSGVARYVVLLDGRAVATTTTPSVALRGLDPAGVTTITVQAVDTSGNTSPSSVGVRVLPDPGPAPTITLSARRTLVRPGVPVDVEATVSGIALGVVEWRLNGELLATGSQLTSAFTSPGSYRVVASVVDRTGQTITQPVDVVVDDRPPALTLLVVRNRLRAAAADAETGIAAVRLISGPGAPRTLGASGIRLPDGRYAVVVRAEDNAGNIRDQRSAVLVDGTPPVLRVRAPGVAGPGRVVADISASDALSGVRRITVDGKRLRNGVTAAALRAGVSHVITAEDGSGNTASIRVRVAELPPLPVRHPDLDGAGHDQLRFGSGRTLTGVPLALLRAVQAQMSAIQALPPGWRVTDRYTTALLRHVQRYQRSKGLPARGTIGPATRAALTADAARAQVTEAR